MVVPHDEMIGQLDKRKRHNCLPSVDDDWIPKHIGTGSSNLDMQLHSPVFTINNTKVDYLIYSAVMQQDSTIYPASNNNFR